MKEEKELDFCKIEYDKVHQDYVCLNCGALFESDYFYSPSSDEKDSTSKMVNYKYCPNCGCRLKKECD